MSQSSDEKLCLQWNDFQTNLTSAFRDLRDDKEFTDVTLACEDGQQVEAHKLVLISSSPFFRNLLKKHKHPHPMIYMRGLKSEDLVAIIDFLYHGEANVYQENLDSFLAIAGELQLKGLHGNQTETASRENPLNPHTQRRHLKKQSNLEMILINFITINNKFDNDPNYERAIALEVNTDLTDTQELSEKVKSMMIFSEKLAPGNQGKLRICSVCGKEGAMKLIIDHIEINHITGILLPCNICEKTFTNRNRLTVHKSRQHKK